MHGFCHVEIPATDLEKSEKFYSSLFGWNTRKMEGMDYVTFGGEGMIGGGIAKVEKIMSDPQICNYVEVEDIEAALKKAEALGARTVQPKTALPADYGAIAVFADPQGYHMGLWAKA